MVERRPVVGITVNRNEDGEYSSLGNYGKGIERIGCDALPVANNASFEEVDQLVEKMDALLVPGGGDVDPACYGAEREPECGAANHVLDALQMRLFHAAKKRGLPILGICRGCQLINVAMGGTLVQDIPKHFGTLHQMPKDHESPFYHDVNIVPGTMLHEIMGDAIPVDSYHHQCIDRLADGLVASAHAPEGFIEAIEAPEKSGAFLMAVQWHPESLSDRYPDAQLIFNAFTKACAERKK